MKPIRLHAAAAAGAGILIVGAVTLAGLAPAQGSTRAPAHSVAAATEPAAPDQAVMPAFVHLPADQAAHPSFENEWWYVVGHLRSHGHVFGYEVQIIARSDIAGTTAPLTPAEAIIAITDVTTGQYYSHVFLYPGQGTFSSTALNASTPNATLSGPLDDMSLHAAMPAGTIDLTLDATGPALYNDGNGLMPLLGGSSYYYSLPTLATRGTITENGSSYPVSGLSWLDHQWGNWDWSTLQKWTWMGIQLSNGDRLDLWDGFTSGSETSFATVLHPDGTEELVAVEPLAPGTSGFVTSPATGQRYGTEWKVEIPSVGASLTVTASPKLQEIQAPEAGGIFEGDSSVSGQYQGHPVTGEAYTEQLGDWHS
jgi:predicted secreted hydrolase